MKKDGSLFNIIWRQTLLAMIMMILSNVGAILMDGVITTRAFGADASAAIGLIAPYAMLISLIGGLIGTGCQTLCSKAMGNADTDEANCALVSSFYFGTAVSVVLTGAVFAFAKPICSFIGASGSNSGLLGETSAYLRGISLGTAGMVLNIILSPVVQLYGGRREVNRSVLVIFISDVAFDLLAVLLDMGCRGIGLASSVSAYLGTFVMLKYALSDKTGISLSPRHFDMSIVRLILSQGLPEAVKRSVRLGQDILANYLVLLTASGAALAGKTIGNLAASFLSCIGIGAASSMYLLSGVYSAMEDEEGLLALGKKQIRHILLALALSLICFVLAPQITGLMLKADAETTKAAVICARCILIQMPVYICFEMVTYYLQNIGHRKDANLISLLGNTVFYLPLVMLGYGYGAPGVILSAPAALLLTLIVFYIRLCLKIRGIAKLRDIMHISECIHPESIDVLARSSIHNLDETVQCSENLRLALLDRGSDEKAAYAVALFIEELCSNIIVHGFAKRSLLSDSEKFASVFAYIENGMITLRIADNCALFDPAEKLKSLGETQADPESGLGLRLVFSMAAEASYTSMLNMNHMLIRVPMHSADIGTEVIAGKLEIFTAVHPG